jgi:hypothetical protein
LSAAAINVVDASALFIDSFVTRTPCVASVDLEDIIGETWIEAGRHLGFPLRLKAEAQSIRIERTLAGHARTRDFTRQVSREAMTANAHDVVGIPLRRPIADLAEFIGHAVRMCCEPVDICVDACREARRGRLRIGTIALPFGRHVATIEKEPRGLVLLHVGRAEYFRELAESASAPEIDLEHAIACRVEALHEERVAVVGRVDVRYAPAVDQNVRWL